MIEIRKTDHFTQRIDGLQDICARVCIQARIERLPMGNHGMLSPFQLSSKLIHYFHQF
jgi:putative component of toxin-antitoxin plasmid stabilization module